MEKYVTEVGRSKDFCPESAINEIVNNTINKQFEWDILNRRIDAIKSYPNPVTPPSCMKLFNGKLEEVTDMRHFLYNKAGAIGIINIDSNIGSLYDHLNKEQYKLYESDEAVYQPPLYPGLYYASYTSDENLNIHQWKSVTNEILECLSKILYWIKFSELTGIDLDTSTLNGPMKRMYDMIIDNKDEFMKDYHMIAFDGNE